MEKLELVSKEELKELDSLLSKVYEGENFNFNFKDYSYKVEFLETLIEKARIESLTKDYTSFKISLNILQSKRDLTISFLEEIAHSLTSLDLEDIAKEVTLELLERLSISLTEEEIEYYIEED